MDFVLGGLVPLAAAVAAYVLARRVSGGRAAAAWSAGVVVGFAAGRLALEARAAGFSVAALRCVWASEAHHWLSLLGLAGALPAVGAALVRKPWVELALAAIVCAAAPVRLLWSLYRANQVRAEFFPEEAVLQGRAVAAVASIAAATLASWWLWRRAAQASIQAAAGAETARGVRLPRVRAFLAIVATVGAAATAALTGAIVFGQAFGVLAAALGGCALAAWLVGDASGPEAARGPALVLFAGLLTAAVGYSEMATWQAAALAAAFVLPVGWLPGVARLRSAGEAALRALVCIAPLVPTVANAAAAFNRSSQAGDAESEDLGGYDLEMYETPPASAPPQSE